MSDNKKIIYIGSEPVEVSKDVFNCYMRSIWNENEKEKRHKNPRIVIDGEKITVKRRREESLDELIDRGIDFADNNTPFEDAVIHKIMLEKAMAQLTDKERSIIDGIYYADKSERELAKEIGIPQRTLHDLKIRILCKLYEVLKD